MSDDSRAALKETGLNIRRSVLGDKYVDASMNKATDFNRPMQELLNEYCWGAAWSNDILSRRERSLMNLAMLTALGRSHEVAVHVRGAKNNGMTNEEIGEIFRHAAIYCGVPAAVDSFRTATPILEEIDSE